MKILTIINQVQALKSSYGVYFLVVLLLILGWCDPTKKDIAVRTLPQSTWSIVYSDKFCSWLSKAYESLGMSNDIQFCGNSSWEKYFMQQRRWVEWGSWRIFFDVYWNEIGSIGQYGAWDGSIPLYPTISWVVYYFNDCNPVNIKKCDVIDLYEWKRWREWVDGRLNQSCGLLTRKMNLNPPRTGKIREYRERYALCTDDKEIFYILFTGQKNIIDQYAPWKNYNTIQYFSLSWGSLWYTTRYELGKETGLLNYITVLGNDSDKVIYSINRCVNSSLENCF